MAFVERYTLTYNEGTLSVYAGFSRLKYLVVQFAQKAFCYHYHIFNMPKKLKTRRFFAKKF